MAAFDDAIACTPGEGPGAYDVLLDAGYGIGDKPNGGYLLATIANASLHGLAAHGGAHAHIVAVTAQYVRAPDAGPALVSVEVVRAGRSASQLRARLVQDDETKVDVLLTAGTLTDEAPWWGDVPPVDVAPFDRCVRRTSAGAVSGFVVHLLDRVDQRIDAAWSLADAAGRPSGRADLAGWNAFPDGREPDPLSLLLAVDAFPPPTFGLGLMGWVPTLSLTAYVRALPAPGPLRVRQRAQVVQGDRVDEVCEVWDSRGLLVAHATQLAGVRTAGVEPAPPIDG